MTQENHWSMSHLRCTAGVGSTTGIALEPRATTYSAGDATARCAPHEPAPREAPYTGLVDTSGQPNGIAHLRCSDGDRDLVANVLGTAFAEGRITFEEHDERLSKVYAARTFGELDALTEDLVVPGSPAALSAGHHAVPDRRFVASAPAAGPVLRDSTTVLSTLRPGSPLHVPTRANLVVILGEARIDLVNATFASETVHINLNVFMGEVRIRVPDGVQVVGSINNIMGEYTARNLPQGPAHVRVELGGSTVMGEVKVLGPGGRPGKYERFVR